MVWFIYQNLIVLNSNRRRVINYVMVQIQKDMLRLGTLVEKELKSNRLRETEK